MHRLATSLFSSRMPSRFPMRIYLRSAVVSWSWGGISSLFASARDPRINALVELDGSMRYYPGLVKKPGTFIQNE